MDKSSSLEAQRGHARPVRRLRPSRCTAGQLRRVGVDLVDEHRLILGCQVCAHRWRPNLQEGGKLPRGYWKCPEGCNAEGVDQPTSP